MDNLYRRDAKTRQTADQKSVAKIIAKKFLNRIGLNEWTFRKIVFKYRHPVARQIL